jgi:hypothetical protein
LGFPPDSDKVARPKKIKGKILKNEKSIFLRKIC